MERIEAGLLVPGKGEPVRDGVVVWDGPAITYAGPAAGAPPAGQAPSTRAVAVLPGLWDWAPARHAHPGSEPVAAGAGRAAGRALRR
jgi:hypothetical protein